MLHNALTTRRPIRHACNINVVVYSSANTCRHWLTGSEFLSSLNSLDADRLKERQRHHVPCLHDTTTPVSDDPAHGAHPHPQHQHAIDSVACALLRRVGAGGGYQQRLQPVLRRAPVGRAPHAPMGVANSHSCASAPQRLSASATCATLQGLRCHQLTPSSSAPRSLQLPRK